MGTWFFQGKVSAQAVGNSEAAVIPAVGNVAWVCNTGTKAARVAFSGTIPAVLQLSAAAVVVPPGTCRALAMSAPAIGPLAQYMLAQCAGNDTTTLDIEFGQGDPTIYTIPT